MTNTATMTVVPAHISDVTGRFCSGGGLATTTGRCQHGCDHADHYANDGHPECAEVDEAAILVRLHAEAVAADKHTGQETTRTTVEASLAKHRELTDACEAYRRKHFPRAGRVVAAFGEVFTISPAGRKITCVYSERGDR